MCLHQTKIQEQLLKPKDLTELSRMIQKYVLENRNKSQSEFLPYAQIAYTSKINTTSKYS